MKSITYFPVYSHYGHLSLENYFSGKNNALITTQLQIAEMGEQDFPLYENEDDALFYLSSQRVSGNDAKWILKLNCSKDDALRLIGEEKLHLHIVQAINAGNLYQSKEIAKAKIKFPMLAGSNVQVKIVDNPHYRLSLKKQL